MTTYTLPTAPAICETLEIHSYSLTDALTLLRLNGTSASFRADAITYESIGDYTKAEASFVAASLLAGDVMRIALNADLAERCASKIRAA